MRYSIRDTVTGQIVRSGECAPGTVELQNMNADEEVITGVALDDLLVYWPPGESEPIARPTLGEPTIEIAADGDPHSVLTGIPAGTRLVQNGLFVELIDDGELTLESAAAGIVTIALDPPFPYQPMVFTVTFS